MSSSSARRVPHLVYGTAWKKDATAEMVCRALVAGFRGMDTAAQPKHYREDLVGMGMRAAMMQQNIHRRDLYIQTKFTSIHGQDVNNMPYNGNSSLVDQVRDSVKSSLYNFRLTDEADSEPSYIDCLVLHSPMPTFEETREVWEAMESFVPNTIHTLGISNVYHASLLERLYRHASVKPSVVQNRFYADTGYDHDVREFCKQHGIIYQSFWTLTANPRLLRSEPVVTLAREVRVSEQVALYALVIGLSDGMSVLNGTTNENRMTEDLQGVSLCREWAASHEDQWSRCQKSFEALLR